MKFKNAINPSYWFKRAINKQIREYSKGVGNEMQYNPLLVLEDMNICNNDKHMTRRMLENSVWYSGIEQDIQYFYQKQAPKFYRKGQQSESLNYFWAQTDTDVRKIHSGFPQLISEKMADLITSSGFEINIEGGNEEKLKEDLMDILKDNKFKSTLLTKSIETESWNGGFTWKITWNPKVSKYPIIQMWQPENYTNRTECGRVVEDIFYIYYERGSEKFRLSEIYGVGDEGAYIDYKLERLIHKVSESSEAIPEWITEPLSELEETKDLKRIDYKGYFKRLSLYKANKLPNSEFRNSNLGESDYAGSYGAFDAVDEILSTWIQEFRDGKLNRYFPEELLPTNDNGEISKIRKLKKDHILYADSPSDNVDKQKIIYEQGKINSEKHVESYKAWVTQILNNAGLSPLTVGITGLEAIDASAESQQEREKVSIRTRNKKIELWTEFLEDYLQTVLEFYYIIENMSENKSGEYKAKKPPEFKVIVTFNDYIIKSRSDRTNEVQIGFGTGWDTLTAVKYIHSDKTEREQLAISARIKLEQKITSITQAELSALQAENLDDNEILQEEGVEIIEPEEPTAEPEKFVEPNELEEE